MMSTLPTTTTILLALLALFPNICLARSSVRRLDSRTRRLLENEVSSNQALTPTVCTSTDECPSQHYCGQGVCRPHASCASWIDCHNPRNSFRSNDCVGFLECHNSKCRKNCKYNSPCVGSNQTDALQSCDPCTRRTCQQATSCINDLCDCRAIFLNAAGTEVCAEECQTSDDCSADRYCARGTCLSMGACQTKLDCFNTNNYNGSCRLEGYTDCVEQQCTCDPAGNECPPYLPPLPCQADPCSVATCNVPYKQCYTERCGSCRTIFLNNKGEQVCDVHVGDGASIATVPTPSPQDNDSCGRNGDCQAGFYCARGTCTAYGSCETIFDCLNPANDHDPTSPLCPAGPLRCNTRTQQCDLDCSVSGEASSCDRIMNCGTGACAATTCNEEHISCVSTNCNFCQASYFNATGHHVCAPQAYCAASFTNCPVTLDLFSCLYEVMMKMWECL